MEALLQELDRSISVLEVTEEGSVVRRVRLLIVHVLLPGTPAKELIEVQQTFPKGRTRARGSAPIIKMRAGEDYHGAAHRGLAARLRLASGGPAPEFDPSTLRTVTDSKPSPSFPNLQCVFEVVHVDAIVPSLSGQPFETTEHYGGSRNRRKCKTLWDWRERVQRGEDDDSAAK